MFNKFKILTILILTSSLFGLRDIPEIVTKVGTLLLGTNRFGREACTLLHSCTSNCTRRVRCIRVLASRLLANAATARDE